jgi:hypothetical protein
MPIWDQVLFVLVAYRLLAPGSEWRLHREWFQRGAVADLLGEDAGLAEIHKLYRCHDRLLVHKQAVFDHLVERWRDLFNITYDVLLYDLTSTYFEADPPFPGGDTAAKADASIAVRSDCVVTKLIGSTPKSEFRRRSPLYQMGSFPFQSFSPNPARAPVARKSSSWKKEDPRTPLKMNGRISSAIRAARATGGAGRLEPRRTAWLNRSAVPGGTPAAQQRGGREIAGRGQRASAGAAIMRLRVRSVAGSPISA